LAARRVLTAPSLGAFAMITSTRSLRDERTTVSFQDFIECWGNDIRWASQSRPLVGGYSKCRCSFPKLSGRPILNLALFARFRVGCSPRFRLGLRFVVALVLA